ncbi:unnamed protein product [Rhizoctonia solani]|uniref:Amidase domain-containing protein n=1 Tax=Rhizoctonia solani TaxID=456999 RepID=A0A8H3B5E6_9AGAM|nr:unnamed protein product [Rhizoctonia solani]
MMWAFKLLLLTTLVFSVWTCPLDKLDLYEASISELQSGLEDGHFTSVDLVRAYLARIDQVNHAGPKLNAVIEKNAHALEQARMLDDERGLTGKRSPLHGIPILVKDSIATLASEGMNTTAGSYAFLGSVVREEATVVAKLRKAGAIILGKTNLCEWSHVRGKLPNGWSARGGQTTNPYYPRADPCGSSSGSAVAMAIGLAAGSLGAETDGSIICPAGFNNVVGIKPTVGLTSRAGGEAVIPISIHQDTIGPITRSVADAATILTVIAGRDERDNFTTSAPTSIPDYTQFLDPSAINGKRFGVPRKVFMNETLMKFHPSVSVEFERALERIKKMGGVVVDPADFPSAEEMSFRREHWVALVQFKASLNAYIKDLAYVSANVSSLADILVFNDEHKKLEEPKGYEDQSTLALAESTNGYNSTYHKFLRQNHILSRERGIDAVLKARNLDALLLPSNLYTALPAALAGYPMVTVPLGFHPQDTKPFPDTSNPNQVLYPAPGMPFGLSFTGTAYTEPSLIGFAYAYEQYTRTRLERRAYKEAVPTIQLGDVVGMHKGDPIVFQA